MKFLEALLSEDSKISSVRLMSVLCVFGAISISFWAVYKDANLEAAAWLVTALLAPAFGGKVIQKKFEKNERSDQITEKTDE